MHRRAIPPANLCTIDTPPENDISHHIYVSDIETPIGKWLTRKNLTESILYIVTTQDVPLRVGGTGSNAQLKNTGPPWILNSPCYIKSFTAPPFPLEGPIPNPFYQKRDAPFRHPQSPCTW